MATGGISTPIILQRSGLTHAGNNLFLDLFVSTFGMLKNGGMRDEIGMAALMMSFMKVVVLFFHLSLHFWVITRVYLKFKETYVQVAATMNIIIFLLLSCPLKFKERGNYKYYKRCQHCY
ncbi:MAG: hypothetical protein ACTSYM_08010 [Candidatus Baldrarchaeia archaeon]